MSPELLNWVLLPLCLALSFWFSGMEAGVLALSRLRIRQQMHAGSSSARVLHQLLENSENFLWTIIVGNTLVNFAALGWCFSNLHVQISGLPVHGWLRAAILAICVMLVVLLFYAFFDLLPKMFFRTYPNRLCLALAQPFRIVHIGLRPLVAIVEWCARMLLRWTGGKMFAGHLFGNREELRAATQESEQVFSSEERAMINRVLDLENLSVRQITKPLAEVVTVADDVCVGDALQLCRESGLTRLPVWQQRGGVRRIGGMMSAEQLIYAPQLDLQRKVAAVVVPALFLEEDSRLDVALDRLQRGGQQLAVVLGRDGQEVGVVTLEDIFKAIFGEVRL